MISKFFRWFGAVVAAIVAAMALLSAVELFSAVVHPFPPDSPQTYEAMCAHVANYPQWVLAAVVPMWAATAYLSTWIAGRLGGRGCAVFVAVLLLSAVMYNLSMLPYPLLFKVAQLIAIVVAVVAAYRLLRPKEMNHEDTKDTKGIN